MGEYTPPRPNPLVFERLDRLRDNVASVIRGKDEVVRLALVPLLARGHLLLNDIPGVGKTMLARAIARSVAADFRRLQFTPDLLPLDVTGSSIYRPNEGEFEFRPGPVFTNVLLADEINRATPRTQSALLECMAERQVTVEGVTHELPDVFFVVATLNPIEHAGTYPLPEAQLDRFLLQIALGYPSIEHEVDILKAQQNRLDHPIDSLKPVMTAEELSLAQRDVANVAVEPAVSRYIVEVVAATRGDDAFRLGGSPRGSLALMRAAQAWALLVHRDFVTPQDVQAMAPHVLGHRVALHPQAALAGVGVEDALQARMADVAVPMVPAELGASNGAKP